ncbi:uncharacterized protein [Miscanthus floridulus]|uniref:uncharacterized protein n=1 Tax=Miscanthus floridulus TaxID=154761 RepID=UPI003458652D
MRSKLVVLVSHELSLSGGPLLLMELAFLLRHVGSQVVWITDQRSEETNDVTYSLEHRMLNHGVQVLPARGQEAVDIALKADLVILNTAVAGKWLDPVLKDHVPKVLPKILWWIHEMRGHYFKVEYVEHLPFVAGAMIDSRTTAEYWKSRTSNLLKCITRKGLQLIQRQKLKVPTMHAVVVGSDMNAQTKFETQLRDFVVKNAIHDRVHFVNKTLAVAPYLAAIDVLVQNSQGTAAGGTTEIVVDGSTGLLHPAGKEGVTPLAKNIARLASHAEQRVSMGEKGYDRVKEMFMEHHMAERIAAVLKEVLRKSQEYSRS